MFEYKMPLFNPAPLRKEILESMRDLAAGEQFARYKSYSDGILSGCELTERDMRLVVGEGLVKFGGRVYVLGAAAGVEYRHTDDWTVLKIRFGGEEKTRDFLRFTGQLTLDDNTNILPNELELGRFKLKRGSRLRTEYVDFGDMETEFDTINPVNVLYAGVGEPALSPVILSHFAREAYSYAKEPLDVSFCTCCAANSGVMSRESLRLYVIRRLERDKRDFTNLELHNYLSEILDEIKGVTRAKSKGLSDGVLLL
jgi:hypothetical protein